jgi:hypothetical protein
MAAKLHAGCVKDHEVWYVLAVMGMNVTILYVELMRSAADGNSALSC